MAVAWVMFALLACDEREVGVGSESEVLESSLAVGHPYASCLPCHGERGEGNVLLKVPRLAGQRVDYLRLQIKAFKDEWRGADVQDVQGRLMAEAIKRLDDDSLNAAIDYIASLEPLPVPASTLPLGDLNRGKYLYEKNCTICHGNFGEGSPHDLSVPRLDIQYDWYMLTQLNHFRTRLRGFHPDDAVGNSMSFYAQLLGEEDAALDVVSWLSSVNTEK